MAGQLGGSSLVVSEEVGGARFMKIGKLDGEGLRMA
jgi:hypothetical protein